MTDLEDKEIQTKWDLIEIWLCVELDVEPVRLCIKGASWDGHAH